MYFFNAKNAKSENVILFIDDLSEIEVLTGENLDNPEPYPSLKREFIKYMDKYYLVSGDVIKRIEKYKKE